MPSRLTIVLITLFWAGTVTWLFFRDVLPRLQSNEPIFFTITKADEFPIGTDVHSTASWTVTRNELDDYRLQTTVTYSRRDDSFQFHGSLSPLRQAPHPGTIAEALPVDVLRSMASVYTVERSGRVVMMSLRSEYSLNVPAADKKHSPEVRLESVGGPVEGSFRSKTRIKFVGPSDFESFKLDPIDVSAQGFILNPLHPPDRITDLHGGQVWNGGVIDPFCLGLVPKIVGNTQTRPAVPDLSGMSKPLQLLRAHVHPDEVDLIWLEEMVSCWKIEYGSEDEPTWITLWVRASDGLVLKQETQLVQGKLSAHDSWIFERKREP